MAQTLPSFSTGGDYLSAFKAFATKLGAFVYMSMCETAFIAHQNAPAFYQEAGSNVAKFGVIVALGFGISTLINIMFLVSGFLTFGKSSAGIILNSYALTDQLAAVARILFSSSLICTYPLLFQGIKPVLTKMLTQRFKHIKDGAFLNQVLTVLPLALITTVSVIISNAGIANAICGSITGSALIYILPPLMYLKSSLPVSKPQLEKVANIALLAFGSILAVVGTGMSFVPSPSPAPPAPAPAPALARTMRSA
eukprot:gnl/MRDRNA2_/MRDRNA2_140971_c0_seq1.p1 gnl/MRDRNA2_/MRDRNA2_140971_c0~~gnl/MRDRNA2_/MRDRNA2_140971_c0_seq1.p1  ORF type:complete len:261 (+),score=40.11 gnl/MRDRNA2_/MRDRNA2_140971_c0_seq1:27-785(+)